MKFLFVYHSAILRARGIAENVAEQLKALGEENIEIWELDRLEREGAPEADMVFAFGGDGTIIHTAAHFLEPATPVLGVNLGTVGFLTNLEVDEVAGALPALLEGDYALDERTYLQAEVYEGEEHVLSSCCINELCIKSPNAHMISFQVVIDGELHSRFRGDGMLVATPTGSTAYALSAGGPVIDPELEVILLTPLVSYLLSKKPLVLAGHHEVSLLGDKKQAALVSVDGMVPAVMEEPFRIVLRQAKSRLLLVNVHKRSFFASVEKRLGQNAAP